MPLTHDEHVRLEEKAHELRRQLVDTTYWAGSAHIGGSLSMLDVMTYLYYHAMSINRDDPHWPDRDRFVLSKGHCGVGYVGVLADLGWLDREELKEFNLTGSKLGMHLDANKVDGVEASTGSLGHGLSIALGMSMAARHLGQSWMTYVLLGDGELNEGSNWEAAMAAAHYHATNLVTIVDRNRCMIDGPTEDVMALEPLDEKFAAFGFDVARIDGHDYDAIHDAVDKAKVGANDPHGKPVAIIADTIKANGIDFMAGDYRWHYGAINDEVRERCMTALDAYKAQRLEAAGRK